MRKIILSLVLLSIGSPCIAQVLEPQWSEFCPPQYLNTEYKQSGFWNSLLYTSRVNIKANNYFVQRKQEFLSSINSCKQNARSANDLNGCYTQVRQMEYNKNNSYNQASQAEFANRQQYLNTVQNIQRNYQQQQLINNQYQQNQQLINAINSPKTYNLNSTGTYDVNVHNYGY